MVVKTIERFVDRLTKSNAGDETETTKTDGGVQVKLFECRDCDITYVGQSVEACSECDGAVAPIQSERDLGFIGNRGK